MPVWRDPELFWLLVPVLAALVKAWRTRPAAIAVGQVKHFAAAAPGSADGPRPWRAWRLLVLLEGLAAAAFVGAMARPQLARVVVPEERVGSDIVLVLDFSNSMDVVDLEPGTDPSMVEEALAEGALRDRLAVARAEIVRFVQARGGDRIGLVIFGHHAYVACPPTLDHDYLTAQVEQLTAGLLPRFERGTNLAGGIGAAVKTLRDGSLGASDSGIASARTVILITDGRNSIADEEFTPLEAALFARDEGVTLHAVGIGSETPYVPDSMGMPMPPASQLQIDEEAMERLVGYTAGRYFRAADNAGFARVMDEIDALETSELHRDALVLRRDLFPYWIAAGLGALLLAALLRGTLLFTVS